MRHRAELGLADRRTSGAGRRWRRDVRHDLRLLNSNYQGRDRGTAYGMWGAVSGASAAIGPIVGGLLTEGISWRWIFFVNLPVSVLAIVLCLTALDDAHATVKRASISSAWSPSPPARAR